MTRAAAILAWLALLVGIPQVMLGILGLYLGSSGMLLFAGLILLPFLPLLLRAWMRERGTPAQLEAVAIALALASMAVSAWTYSDVMRTFGED